MSVPYRFNTKKLKKNWRSPVYAFFNIDRVAVQNVDGRNCHFFPCAAQKCKTRIGGVRRFQDSKDKASTANLKNHAIGCFGNEAVKVACVDKQAPDLQPSGSIFTAFARKDKEPVNYSHRSHTNPQVRYVYLPTAGRPSIQLPSRFTISRDIKASFEKCSDRIGKLLREYPGRLHFATDAWTSPNHRAFVAWTVHLEFNGEMLCFLLDIVELAESHTGVALARAFQAMLERFGLTDRVG
ncbi:uncharacterized protein BJ212DRAFT_1281314 [Suillus subaureus]|uniref:Uncharacterized protein n=1 Tax=Suillus subaureus TaxID=48587 RepID=A0A9P7E155_9AGAM|nr:uncharacterized protein BJ212DRAFT_1281314 [Suillus subaureus]KAG1808062.1 hypothetical protein BJ212DRAFT_1281314 [Suillus subaureus]